MLDYCMILCAVFMTMGLLFGLVASYHDPNYAEIAGTCMLLGVGFFIAHLLICL